MKNEHYEVKNGILVYKVQEWPDGSRIETFVGPDVTCYFDNENNQVMFKRWNINDEYEGLETVDIPMIGEEIDYEAIENRIAYWRSQGSA